jgi:DNA-binding CsgD family transcriptional regulator
MSMPATAPSARDRDCRPPSGSVHPRRPVPAQAQALASMLATVASLPAPAGRSADGRGSLSVHPVSPARVTGCRQVQAVVSALAASAGTVTWLCIGAGHEPPLPGEDPVTGPLLAGPAPVRMLCAPDTGRVHAGPVPGRTVPAGSVRLACYRTALDMAHSDVLTAPGADTLVVVPGPAGAVYADALPGQAVNTLVRALVESLWDASLPMPSVKGFEAVTHDPVKLKILGLLESGAKDEVIARALNMSLRTCRRHIADLLVAVGAVSRFQAASRLARAGVLGAAR